MRIALLFAVAAMAATPLATFAADMLGDEVHAVVINPFSTVVDGVAVVGPGVEFTGNDPLARSYELNLAANRFSLTVSKPSSAGNFTAIVNSIVIDGLDHQVADVTFDVGLSSSFSSGDPDDIDLGTPGRIAINFGGFASANTPATALSQTFVWNVALDNVPVVPEPASSTLMLLGLAGLVMPGWRRHSRGLRS